MPEAQAPKIHTETMTLSVSDGTKMPGFVARPDRAGPHPGLIVFQEAFGVNAHIRDVTQRFARAGYLAVAPALFHRTDPNFQGNYTDMSTAMPHMQAMTEQGLADDIRAAYVWLTAADGGKAKAVGSVGYCMGGRASYFADALVPLQASVSYYGGGIAPGLLGRAGDLHAPILLYWGGLDTHITTDQVRSVEDALKAAGKNYAQVVFSKAGHGFFCDARAAYEPNAARQSWALTLAFLASYVQV